jgi:hypothetical protein
MEGYPMNKIRLLCIVTWIAGLLVLMITLMSILALTDISRDYVSQSVFEVLDVTLPSALPDWTDTRGEWQVVELTVYSSVAFLILNAITLWLAIRRLKHLEEPAA